MRKLRTTLLLALTVAAVGAFAAPAMAIDYEWTNEGEPITSPMNIEFDGEVHYFRWYEIYCDVEGEATLTPGGGGEVTKFVGNNCEAINPHGFKCNPGTLTSTAPWSMEIQGQDAVAIQEVDFTVNCGGEPIQMFPIEMIAEPDSPNAMSNFYLYKGSGTGWFREGSLDILPAGAIGIAEA